MIMVEDFDSSVDSRFVKDFLNPYFSDLYKDISLRCLTSAAIRDKKLDRIALLEYCNLPGIVNERLLKLFEPNPEGLISESNFSKVLSNIFASELDTRMKLTFNM
jgi:hypothetical protein